MKNCIYRVSASKMSSGQIPYCDGYDSYDFPKKIPFNKTTYGSQKEYIKNECLRSKWALEKFCTMPGTVVMIFQKNSFQWNPFRRSKKINKKNASSDNLTTKKMNTVLSLYYDEFGSYDFPKIKSCLIQISSGS